MLDVMGVILSKSAKKHVPYPYSVEGMQYVICYYCNRVNVCQHQ